MAGTTIEEAVSASAVPAPDWQKFETDDLELCLPERYFGGDPKTQMGAIRERCSTLGPGFEARSRQLRKLQLVDGNAEYRFIALDSDRPGVTVHVLHVRLPLLKRGLTLEKYMQICMREARQAGGAVSEQSVVGLGPYSEAGRFVVDMIERHVFHKPGPVLGRQLSYAVKGCKAFWLVQYSAGIDDWERLLPVFERSAATLGLKELRAA